MDAMQAYQAVVAAQIAVERAEGASYYDPARICRARVASRAALAAWETAYPEAAAERRAQIARKSAKEQARRDEDFRNSFIGRGID